MGSGKSSSKRGYSNKSLAQETRKKSNNLTFHLKELKKKKNKLKVRRRKEIIKKSGNK